MAHVNEKHPGVPTVVLSSLLETEILQIRAEEGEEAALDYMELCGIEESKMDTHSFRTLQQYLRSIEILHSWPYSCVILVH